MDRSSHSISFGEFQLDCERGELWRGDALVDLAPKPLSLLVYLAQHRTSAVPKHELLEQLWPECSGDRDGALERPQGPAPGDRRRRSAPTGDPDASAPGLSLRGPGSRGTARAEDALAPSRRSPSPTGRSRRPSWAARPSWRGSATGSPRPLAGGRASRSWSASPASASRGSSSSSSASPRARTSRSSPAGVRSKRRCPICPSSRRSASGCCRTTRRRSGCSARTRPSCASSCTPMPQPPVPCEVRSSRPASASARSSSPRSSASSSSSHSDDGRCS